MSESASEKLDRALARFPSCSLCATSNRRDLTRSGNRAKRDAARRFEVVIEWEFPPGEFHGVDARASTLSDAISRAVSAFEEEVGE